MSDMLCAGILIFLLSFNGCIISKELKKQKQINIIQQVEIEQIKQQIYFKETN